MNAEVNSMTEAIVTACVTGGLALVGTAVTAWAAARRTRGGMETRLELMNQELTHLTAAIGRSNDFAGRIPVLEERVTELTRRIELLERSGRRDNDRPNV